MGKGALSVRRNKHNRTRAKKARRGRQAAARGAARKDAAPPAG